MRSREVPRTTGHASDGRPSSLRAVLWNFYRHVRVHISLPWPAVKAVTVNKLLPGLLDRALAKQGYSGQITQEPLPEHACANLYDPCDSDAGAHGRFDRQARAGSGQWWLTTHRALTTTCVALLGAVLVAALAWT